MESINCIDIKQKLKNRIQRLKDRLGKDPSCLYLSRSEVKQLAISLCDNNKPLIENYEYLDISNTGQLPTKDNLLAIGKIRLKQV